MQTESAAQTAWTLPRLSERLAGAPARRAACGVSDAGCSVFQTASAPAIVFNYGCPQPGLCNRGDRLNAPNSLHTLLR